MNEVHFGKPGGTITIHTTPLAAKCYVTIATYTQEERDGVYIHSLYVQEQKSLTLSVGIISSVETTSHLKLLAVCSVDNPRTLYLVRQFIVTFLNVTISTTNDIPLSSIVL